MEVKRQLDVLDRRLADRPFVAGDDYTIADIAIFPWYGALVLGWANDVTEFLSTHEYRPRPPLGRRPVGTAGVRRGRLVNRTQGDWPGALRERHDAADFEA